MSISEKKKRYEAIRAYLGMKHELVGIKLIAEEDESMEVSKSDRPGGRNWYCRMVREAACGK